MTVGCEPSGPDEREWTAPSARRSANYTNLPPGSYRFEVASVGQNGAASELDFRQAENALLVIKSGLLTLDYQENVALAEWDRATGRYFQFSHEVAQNVP